MIPGGILHMMWSTREATEYKVQGSLETFPLAPLAFLQTRLRGLHFTLTRALPAAALSTLVTCHRLSLSRHPFPSSHPTNKPASVRTVTRLVDSLGNALHEPSLTPWPCCRAVGEHELGRRRPACTTHNRHGSKYSTRATGIMKEA